MLFCNLKSSFLVLLSIVDADGQIYARMTNHGSESIRNVIFYCQSLFLQSTFIRYMNVTEAKGVLLLFCFFSIMNFLIHI